MYGNDFAILKGPILQSAMPTRITITAELTDAALMGVSIRPLDSTDWIKVQASRHTRFPEVQLTGLKPDSQYEYFITAEYSRYEDHVSVRSETYIFQTTPAVSRPFHFVVFGDHRSQPEVFAELCRRIVTDQVPPPDFIVNTGDLVSDGTKEKDWNDHFFGPARDIVSRFNFWPAIGNHERNAQFYFDIFSLPGNERYYTFDILHARFIAIDTCWDFAKGTRQYQWIEAALRKARQDGKTWVIVYGHHPPYTSGPHGRLQDGLPREYPVRTAQRDLVPLYERYGVDLVFSGHDHVYERSHKGSVAYVTSGGGGAPLYEKSETAGEQNPYSRYFKSTYHYSFITIDGGKLQLKAIDIDGREFDWLELQK